MKLDQKKDKCMRLAKELPVDQAWIIYENTNCYVFKECNKQYEQIAWKVICNKDLGAQSNM